MTGRDFEIAELRRMVDELNIQTSRNELEKQNMRNVRRKLDGQIDLFNQIHRFTQMAFRAEGQEALLEIIAEGAVDIFQLEVSAIYLLNVSGDAFELVSSLNLDSDIRSIPINRDWFGAEDSPAKRREVICESPVTSAALRDLGLCHAIYFPFTDNRHNLEGIVLAGVTESSCAYYDFEPEEITSSFRVYCQHMNGIYNNTIAIRQAHEAAESKTRFLANLSHEIRTPMNAIIGMVQIADRSDDFQEVKRCVKQIDTSSKHLLTLLNDVLDISKIEQGKLTLNSEPFSLDEALRDVVDAMAQSASSKGLSLRLCATDAQNLRVIGDSMRLKQVLLNFISNAVKFTSEGGRVDVDVRLESSDDKENALIRFAVSDTGIGMTNEELGRIFNAFEQADSSTSRKYGGTGLGLAISKRIVEFMGGAIQVDSRPGEGSTFSFAIWLPIDPDADEIKDMQALPGAQAYDFSGLHLLIADDIQINREIVFTFLEDTGATFDAAVNGLEAVEKFRASEVGRYQLILMDVQMPEMDGLEATRIIRSLDRPDAKTVVILAMTANVFLEDRYKVVSAGMNGHIGKPIEYETLIHTIAQALRLPPK